MLQTSTIVLLTGVLTCSGPLMPTMPRDVTDYCRSHLLLSPYSASNAMNPVVDTQEMLSKIKDEGLPVSAIAELMRVERKSIYNWLDGGNIQDHNFTRLSRLYALLISECNQANLKNLYRLFRRPLANGKTLYALLTEQDLDEVSIQKALDYLWPVAAAYQEKENRRPVTMSPRENPVLAEIPEVITSNGSRTL